MKKAPSTIAIIYWKEKGRALECAPGVAFQLKAAMIAGTKLVTKVPLRGTLGFFQPSLIGNLSSLKMISTKLSADFDQYSNCYKR
jgi:hypothetical protein